MTDIPLKGNFGNVRLPLILIFINRRRLTGTLEVKVPAFTKKVFIINGDAIFASSTHEDDRLGEMLLKVGKITVEHYDKSVARLRNSNKRLGAILVELGYITPKELFWGVKYQVREIIYSLFQLEEGDYEFTEGDVPYDEVITLKMSMGNLIYEGGKRIESLTRIRREMPSMNDVLMLSDDPLSLFQNIELSSHDKKILSLVDGIKTIKEIIDSSWMGSFDAMKILYVLFYTGFLILRQQPDEAVETISVDEMLKDLAEDEMTFEKRIDEFLQKVKKGDPLELLELENNADAATLKKNYFRLTKEFHPDKYYESEDLTLKDKLSTIFDALTDAYNYLKGLEVRGKDRPAAEKQKTISQKPEQQHHTEQFQMGIAHFKKGNINNAVDSFKAAIKLDKKNAQYWSYLSLALSRMPKMLKQAEEALLEAIKLEPDNPDFLTNLGIIYMKSGVIERAKTQFEKALILDPKNMRAQKGLNELKKSL